MDLSANELYLVELINRARSDPAAEAGRHGIGLNDGLAPGTLDADPLEPLAVSPHLNSAADAHSADMEARDYFSHVNPDGETPTERIFDAGWESAGDSWRTGENIAARFSTGSLTGPSTIEQHHEGLFLSPGHRANILSDTFSEIGVGQTIGSGTINGTAYPNASYVTQKFADGGRTYLTGVVIDDADGDAFYDVGEGLGNVTVAVAGDDGAAFEVRTGAAGGYSVAVADGHYTLTFSGGGLSGEVVRTVTVDGRNVKVDVDADDAVAVANDTSAKRGGTGDDADAATGATAERGDAGGSVPRGVSLTGTNGADRLPGSDGPDMIHAGRGADKVNGKAGADIVFGQGGNDTVAGGSGDDSVWGANGRDKLAGGAGDDVLAGGAGADTLAGGAGDDILVAGAGRDIMVGGAGADRFVFEAGLDIIRFAEADTLDLSSAGLASFDDVLAALTERNGKLHINLGGGDRAVLMVDDDFVFGADDVIL